MRLFPPQGCVCADDYLLVGLGPPLLAALAPRGLRGELRTPIEPVVTDGVADLEAEPRLHGRFLVRALVALGQDAGFHARGTGVGLVERLAGQKRGLRPLVAPRVRVLLVHDLAIPVALQTQPEQALAGMGAVNREVQSVGSHGHELAAVHDVAALLVPHEVASFPVDQRGPDEARHELRADGAVHPVHRRRFVGAVDCFQFRRTHRGAAELRVPLKFLVAERVAVFLPVESGPLQAVRVPVQPVRPFGGDRLDLRRCGFRRDRRVLVGRTGQLRKNRRGLRRHRRDIPVRDRANLLSRHGNTPLASSLAESSSGVNPHYIPRKRGQLGKSVLRANLFVLISPLNALS